MARAAGTVERFCSSVNPLPEGDPEVTMIYYRTFNEYLRERYGCKVYRIPVSIGASCPNRSGALSGCVYCDERGSASPVIERTLPLNKQIAKGMTWAMNRHRAKKYIVYFQPFTNTFVPISHLCESVSTALRFGSVVGVAIGTRPDCLPDEMVEAIAAFADKTDMWIELGLQSAHHRTLAMIKRGHTLAAFIDAVLRIKKMGRILVAAHIIIGLPGETGEDVIETARILAALPIDGIKIHLLHVLKNSQLAHDYRSGKLKVLSLSEYASLVVDVVEHLPEHVVIQRITAEADQEHLVAPLWCLDKQKVIAKIHDVFKSRNTCQGKRSGFGLSLEEIERRTLETIPSELGRN